MYYSMLSAVIAMYWRSLVWSIPAEDLMVLCHWFDFVGSNHNYPTYYLFYFNAVSVCFHTTGSFIQFLLSKGEHGILSLRNGLWACCTCEGETGINWGACMCILKRTEASPSPCLSQGWHTQYLPSLDLKVQYGCFLDHVTVLRWPFVVDGML